MPKPKAHRARTRRPSAAQIVFLVLTLVIILSTVLALLIKY